MNATQYQFVIALLSLALLWAGRIILRLRRDKRAHRALHRRAGGVVIAAREFVHHKRSKPRGQTAEEWAQWTQTDGELLEKLGETVKDFDRAD